jgi:hypothetical protein
VEGGLVGGEEVGAGAMWQSGKVARFQSFKVSKFQGFKVSKFLGVEVSVLGRFIGNQNSRMVAKKLN